MSLNTCIAWNFLLLNFSYGVISINYYLIGYIFRLFQRRVATCHGSLVVSPGLALGCRCPLQVHERWFGVFLNFKLLWLIYGRGVALVLLGFSSLAVKWINSKSMSFCFCLRCFKSHLSIFHLQCFFTFFNLFFLFLLTTYWFIFCFTNL